MKIRIRVTRLTEYESIVEMPQEQYDALRAALDAGGTAEQAAEQKLNGLINPNDWQDDELRDVDDFEPFMEAVAQ